MTWPIVKLGSVCKLVNGDRGKNYPSKDSILSYGIPFINAGNLTDDHSVVCSGANYISEERYNLLSNGKIQCGDILFCLRGSLGKFAVVDSSIPKGAIASSLVIIRPGNTVCENYLKNYLRSTLCAREISRFENGAAQPNLSAKDLREFEIPLPPLAEQQRIAAILDKADAIRRKRQQAIQLADDFLRAMFLDMFGEVVTPSGYESVQKFKIIDLVDYIDYRGKTPEKSVSGVPLITAKNVKSGYVDDEPREHIPEDNYVAWMSRGIPKENDVLFTTEAPLGNVALLGKYEKVAVGQRLIALRSKGRVTHEYLLYLLLHPFIQDLIYARSSGSTVKGIRTKELYAIELPVPEIEKQREFSSIYWKFTSLKKNQGSAFQGNDLNFKALSQKAFRGEL